MKCVGWKELRCVSDDDHLETEYVAGLILDGWSHRPTNQPTNQSAIPGIEWYPPENDKKWKKISYKEIVMKTENTGITFKDTLLEEGSLLKRKFIADPFPFYKIL